MLRTFVLTALIVALPMYGLAAVMLPEQCPDGRSDMRMASSQPAATPCDDGHADTNDHDRANDKDHFCKNGQECQSRVMSETTISVAPQSYAVATKALDQRRHEDLPRGTLSTAWRPPRSV